MQTKLFMLIILALASFSCAARKAPKPVYVDQIVATKCRQPDVVAKPDSTCLYAIPASATVDAKIGCLTEVYFDTLRWGSALEINLDGYRHGEAEASPLMTP